MARLSKDGRSVHRGDGSVITASGGRPMRATTGLKMAILMAAEQTGFDSKGQDGLTGYLRFLAQQYPSTFATLLGKVLPHTLAGDPDAPIRHDLGWIDHMSDEEAVRLAGVMLDRRDIDDGIEDAEIVDEGEDYG